MQVASYEFQVWKKEEVGSIELVSRLAVSQFTGYPVEELKSGWYTGSTNFHLVTENLYLKLTIGINWSTGKPGNWVTKLTCRLNYLVNWKIKCKYN